MSLRLSMSLALIAMLLALGAFASAMAYGFALREAGQFMDDQMRQLASIVDERTRPGAIGALQEPEDRFAVRIENDDGRSIMLAPPMLATPSHKNGFQNVSAAGEEWRSYADHQRDRTIIISQRMAARREIATHSAMEVAVPILASVPLASLIVFAVVSRLMRPLTRLGGKFEAGEISQLVDMPIQQVPAELRPFVAAVADLVMRLQSALEKQQRFVADAAHQLRTPIAAVRLQIENLSTLGLDKADTYPLNEGMRRVSSMLNQLLTLARFDGQSSTDRPETVDLCELLRQCIADQVELADEKKLDLGIKDLCPVSIRAVRSDLSLLLANVIENAIRYTPAGGTIDCSLMLAAETAQFVVEDTGPGVLPEHLARITERFYRCSVDCDGSGLGLAIVKAAAERNSFTLDIANRQSCSGLSVKITMPSALCACI